MKVLRLVVSSVSAWWAERRRQALFRELKRDLAQARKDRLTW